MIPEGGCFKWPAARLVTQKRGNSFLPSPLQFFPLFVDGIHEGEDLGDCAIEVLRNLLLYVQLAENLHESGVRMHGYVVLPRKLDDSFRDRAAPLCCESRCGILSRS